jgi:hypothetical protein
LAATYLVLLLEADMAETYEELRKLSMDELIQRYDRVAKNTVDSQLFLREEIARRDAEAQTAQMIRINNQMRYMTIIITISTIISTVAVIISILR